MADGARQIVIQVEERCGNQARFLVDFCHESEYLAAVPELLGERQERRAARTATTAIEINQTSDVIRGPNETGSVRESELAGVVERSSVTKEVRSSSACERRAGNIPAELSCLRRRFLLTVHHALQRVSNPAGKAKQNALSSNLRNGRVIAATRTLLLSNSESMRLPLAPVRNARAL